jgi:hypothetical protein
MVRGIAEDLGDERGALRHWLDLYGTDKKIAADGTLTTSPLKSPRHHRWPREPMRRPSNGLHGSKRGSVRSRSRPPTDHRARDSATGGQEFRRETNW